MLWMYAGRSSGFTVIMDSGAAFSRRSVSQPIMSVSGAFRSIAARGWTTGAGLLSLGTPARQPLRLNSQAPRPNAAHIATATAVLRAETRTLAPEKVSDTFMYLFTEHVHSAM